MWGVCKLGSGVNVKNVNLGHHRFLPFFGHPPAEQCKSLVIAQVTKTCLGCLLTFVNNFYDESNEMISGAAEQVLITQVSRSQKKSGNKITSGVAKFYCFLSFSS